MAGKTKDAPNEFALAVSVAVRREIGRMSGRALARALGRSEKYVRDRLNDSYSWELNDIDGICQLIGKTPEEFIDIVEIDMGRYQPEHTAKVTSIVDVSRLSEDELLALPHAANRDDSAGESESPTP